MTEKFELEVLTRLAVIENKIDDYKLIKEKSEESYNLSKKNEKELQDIKDTTKWIWRTIIASIIGGIGIILKNIIS